MPSASRMSPPVTCNFGASYNSIITSVEGQKLTSWATRQWYDYTGLAPNGECEVVIKRCPLGYQVRSSANSS
jgi:hypothetical protein